MAKHEGKCPNCGKTHYADRKGDVVVCDCWRFCPLCGAEMTPYTPDLAMNVYAVDGKRELNILMVCTFHSPPFSAPKNQLRLYVHEKSKRKVKPCKGCFKGTQQATSM